MIVNCNNIEFKNNVNLRCVGQTESLMTITAIYTRPPATVTSTSLLGTLASAGSLVSVSDSVFLSLSAIYDWLLMPMVGFPDCS